MKPIWLSAPCQLIFLTKGKFSAKITKNAFLPLKWPFIGQPDNHIGWATSLALRWISSIYPRTLFWNFGEKMFRNGGFEKLTFFETIKFQYSISDKIQFFLSFLLKCLKNSWVAWTRFDFYDYSDFQQNIRGI